jgi:hypothetical protein
MHITETKSDTKFCGKGAGAVGWATALQDSGFRVRFPVGSLEISKWPLPSGNLASETNKYEAISMAVKCGRRIESFYVVLYKSMHDLIFVVCRCFITETKHGMRGIKSVTLYFFELDQNWIK